MAKDDRRNTTGAVLTSGFHARGVDNDESRRRTIDVPRGKSNNGQRASLRVEKTNDVRKKTVSRTNHYDMFRGQIEAYKDSLTKELKNELNKTDGELTKNLDNLAENFEEQCRVIQAAGRPLERNIAHETVTIQKPVQAQEPVTLDRQMARFKKVKEEKYAQLTALWKEYETIQAQLMQFAISILGEENTEITEQQLPGEEGDKQKQDQTKPKLSGLDLKEAGEQHADLKRGYEDAFAALSGMQKQLDNMTATTLKENKAMLQSFKTHRGKKVDELRDFLDSMGML